MNCIYWPNPVKLGLTVTFRKYLASVILLILLPKTLNWNKITFLALNWLNLAGLVVNEFMRRVFKNLYQYSFFYEIYCCLI